MKGEVQMSDTIIHRLRSLPLQDRRLVIILAATALVALLIGLAGGGLTALVRAGFLPALPESGYRFLTVHGVSAFFYWLYFAQAALLLGFAAAERGNGGDKVGLARRWLSVLGAIAMVLGFVLGLYASVIGSPPLYDGNVELLADEPMTVLVFSLGYALLGLGLILVPATAIATLLPSLGRGRRRSLDALGFALLAWSGFLIVTGFAAIHSFLPAGIALGPGAGRFSGGPGNRMAHPVSQPALPAAHGDGPSLVHPDAGADRREVGVRGQVLEAGLQPLPGLRAADLALPHVPRPRPAGVCQGGGLGAVAVRLGADADRLPGDRRIA